MGNKNSEPRLIIFKSSSGTYMTPLDRVCLGMISNVGIKTFFFLSKH